MHCLSAAAAALTLAAGALAQAAPAFRFPAPALAGRFADLLGDELTLQPQSGRLRAAGRLGGRDCTLDAAEKGAGLQGTATLGTATLGTATLGTATLGTATLGTGSLGNGSLGNGSLGNGTLTPGELPCTGSFDGETLVLRLGDSEFRLRPELELLPALADLGPPEPDPERQWTVAVYLGGDNDLEPAAIRDLLEMQAGVPASGCTVVALIDRRKDADDGPDDWTDTRVLHVLPGSDGQFANLATPGELDTSDARTLASFATGVFRRFPARHHALFVWDHGGGYTGICVDEDAPGRAAGKRQLSLRDVREGIATALQRAGLLRLDLVAFDACLMAQLDVALAMHDLADAMVASEAIVPGTGYPYTQVLAQFAADRGGCAVAKALVDDYGAFSEDAFASGSTLSAFDLRQAAAVAAALDRLAREALAVAGEQWRALARGLFYAECYQARHERTEDSAVCSLDLCDLAARWNGVPGIAAGTIEALRQSVAALVLGRYGGAERTLSSGLSVYGPHRRGQYRGSYDQTPLGLGNAWRPLLQRVHALAAADQAELTVGEFRQLDALGQPSAEARPFGGQRLSFAATGGSIVEVQVHDWQFEAEGDRWLLLRARLVTDPLWPARWATAVAADLIDLVMPQFQEGRNELYHELDGLTFAITDGTLQTYGTLDMATASMQAPITALARCTPLATGKPLLVEVAFDRAEWHAVAVRPVQALDGGALPRSVVPAAGDTFEFLLVTRGADGQAGSLFTPALTWGEAGLALLAEPDEPGRYRVEMVARTIQGRTARGQHEYTVAANPDLAAWPASWQQFEVAALAGKWTQHKVVGPQQYQDLKTTCTVEATEAGNLFAVLAQGGPPGGEFETHQIWSFEWRGLPCLRIVTHIADGQKYGWYGPVRVDRRDGKLVLAMKAVNATGVVWEWRQQ